MKWFKPFNFQQLLVIQQNGLALNSPVNAVDYPSNAKLEKDTAITTMNVKMIWCAHKISARVPTRTFKELAVANRNVICVQNSPL